MNPWALVYDSFVPEQEGLREALCTLGNGYFATRGAAAESSADEVHYPGTYLAGGYNRLQTTIAGRTVENEDPVNLPNWLPLAFRGRWRRVIQPDGRRGARPSTGARPEGVPARGWHGEAYRGHVFWDELFVFPMLNLRLPKITRSLLKYCYRRLGEARAAAARACCCCTVSSSNMPGERSAGAPDVRWPSIRTAFP